MVCEHADRGFRRSIVVEDFAVRCELAKALDPFSTGSLAAQNQALFGQDPLGFFPRLQRSQVRGNNLQHIDMLALKVVRELGLALGAAAGDDVQAAAGGQCWKDHGIAEIGRDRRYSRVVHTGCQLQTLRNTQYIIHDAPMFDAYPFGSACRPAGIDHISEIAGIQFDR
jgi:hypothetical protein